MVSRKSSIYQRDIHGRSQHEGCQYAVALRRGRGQLEPFDLSVNVTAQQFAMHQCSQMNL